MPNGILPGAMPYKPIPGNSPREAPAYTKASPYWSVGRLCMKFPNNKSYFGTGTLISTKHKGRSGRYVATAAHNLYDPEDGGEATGVTFQRGLNNQNDPPYEPIDAERLFYPEKFKDTGITKSISQSPLVRELDFALDYGLVLLSSPAGTEDFPKLLALSTDDLESMNIDLIGLYGYKDEERSMFVGSGSISNITRNEVGYNVSTKKGCSGTGVFLSDQFLVAIHNHKGKKHDNNNYGRRVNDELIKAFHRWEES